jgi:hypothetical protein
MGQPQSLERPLTRAPMGHLVHRGSSASWWQSSCLEKPTQHRAHTIHSCIVQVAQQRTTIKHTTIQCQAIITTTRQGYCRSPAQLGAEFSLTVPPPHQSCSGISQEYLSCFLRYVRSTSGKPTDAVELGSIHSGQPHSTTTRSAVCHELSRRWSPEPEPDPPISALLFGGTVRPNPISRCGH